MLTKIIVAILIPAFLMHVVGCYSEYLISKENLNTEQGDIRVITNDKREYNGAQRLWKAKDDTLVIYDGQLIKQHEIPYNLIDETYIDKVDGAKTAVLLTTVAIVVGTIIYVVIKNFRLNMFSGNFFK